MHPFPPARASPSDHRVLLPHQSEPLHCHHLEKLFFFFFFTPFVAVIPKCQARCLILPNLQCPHFTDEETEPCGGQETKGQGPTARGRYRVLDSRPGAMTPPSSHAPPPTATSAATCRLTSGSRCEASQWGWGAHSRLPGEQLFSESQRPGAMPLLCSPVDKVLHLGEALSKLQGH